MRKINHILFIIIIFQSFTISAQPTIKNRCCKKENIESWRVLAEQGKYQEAIKELKDSIQEYRKADKHANYWHIGQLYACDNDYKNAIIYFKKSTSIFNRIFDRQWNWYYKGTIAFLKKDKRKLNSCYTKLWSKNTGYYHNNACTLKALSENFDKSYKEASAMPCK